MFLRTGLLTGKIFKMLRKFGLDCVATARRSPAKVFTALWFMAPLRPKGDESNKSLTATDNSLKEKTKGFMTIVQRRYACGRQFGANKKPCACKYLVNK